MKPTPLGTPLIWFKLPSSLLPHNSAIESRFPRTYQTDFRSGTGDRDPVQLAKNVTAERALDVMSAVTPSAPDISDRVLQKSEKQFGRCKSFDTYAHGTRLCMPMSC